MWKVGDRVTRNSYGRDICFLIAEVDQAKELAILKGMDVRLVADSPLQDLVPVTEEMWNEWVKRIERQEQAALELISRRRQVDHEKFQIRTLGGFARGNNEFFERPGRVLHLDGDGRYLQKCLNYYQNLGIPAVGHHLHESKMPEVLGQLLHYYEPDILIITGHDAILGKAEDWHNIENYRNSDYFIRAVRAARQYERSFDDLIIIAGACQSHYEGLLAAGANFASSPARILIHALDPVLVAEKIAFTPIHQTVNIYETVKSTLTGTDGVGGIETRGKYRRGIPKSVL